MTIVIILSKYKGSVVKATFTLNIGAGTHQLRKKIGIVKTR